MAGPDVDRRWARPADTPLQRPSVGPRCAAKGGITHPLVASFARFTERMARFHAPAIVGRLPGESGRVDGRNPGDRGLDRDCNASGTRALELHTPSWRSCADMTTETRTPAGDSAGQGRKSRGLVSSAEDRAAIDGHIERRRPPVLDNGQI